MVSVLLYVEVALSTRVWVNEYIVSLAGSVTPSLVHVTVVGGEPVEVQVRVVKEDEVFCSKVVTWGTAAGRKMYRCAWVEFITFFMQHPDWISETYGIVIIDSLLNS